jgi:hypothetical protein
MAQVTMGTLRAWHQQEAREAAAFQGAAAARAEVDALADAATEAARARAMQAQAEVAAQWAHWVNALAEGQAGRTAEELHSQRSMQRAEAEMHELTPCKRHRLANFRRRHFWGPSRCRAPLVLLAVAAVTAAPGPLAGSRASDCE